MLKFVKEQKQILKFDPTPTNEKLLDFAINVIKHEELLSQQPNIGMFVPAVCEDGVWRVLEEPNPNLYNSEEYIEQYQQAQSKVIFKGWELESDLPGLTTIKSNINDGHELFFDLIDNKCRISNYDFYMKIHTLEDLVKFNLEMV